MACRFSMEGLPYEATPVDNLFLMEYMPHANGVQLQVYLYGLMHCRYPALSGTPLEEALTLSSAEVIDAFAYWQREGLVYIRSAEPLEVEYRTPSERMAQPLLVPGKYNSLVQAVQSLFAPRTLRANELRRVYDWIEVFALDEGAVLELVSYCLHRKGARVSMQYMDAVARAWADADVHTAQEARIQAAAHEELSGGAAAVLKRWSKDRRPTQDELALYDKWTQSWGFTKEAVLAACPALLGAERPSFKYLDGVLERLYRDGVLSEQEIARAFGAQDEDAALARDVFEKLGMARGARVAEREELKAYIEGGMPLDVLLYAAEQARASERAYPALKRLMKEYEQNDIRTLEQANAYEPKRGIREGKKEAAAMAYEQRRYSEEELKHIYINLDEQE